MTPPTLSPFWKYEEALTRHYLRSDGGFGSAPLSFLDASGPELARAVGKGPEEAGDVLAEFLAMFRRNELVWALSHGYAPAPPAGVRAPGFLNFLILSCHVASVAPDVSSSGDYRDRLQEILGLETRILTLSGLRQLWERLPRWIEDKRSRGQSYRRVVLPDYGTMRQIGYSVRIAFPSRHDLGKMERLFGCFAESGTPKPNDLIAMVVPELNRHNWSPGFVEAFADFHARRKMGERLLADHPFWLGILGLRPRVSASTAEAVFDIVLGTDSDGRNWFSVRTDVPQISERLAGRSDTTGIVEFEAARSEILHFLAHPPSSVPSWAVRAFTDGVIPFSEIEWGVWQAERVPTGARVRLLVRGDHLKRHGLPSAGNDGWRLLEPVGHAEALVILERMLGRREPTPELARIRICGGVRMDKAYLGRPGFLPVIEAVEGCHATPVAFDGSDGAVTATTNDGTIALEANKPVEGAWRVSIREGDAVQAEPNLVFEANARECLIPDPEELAKGWRPDEPGLAACAAMEVGLAAAPPTLEATATRLSDLLEALFAKGARGLSEQEIVPLIAPRLPEPYAVWDILQLLADSGWMEPRISREWRARRWFLRPPRLLTYRGEDAVLLDGAAPELTRRRFEAVVRSLQGTVEWRKAPGAWAIAAGIARGVSPEKLSEFIGLPLSRATVEVPPIGMPIQFRPTLYGESHRVVAATWDWSRKRFSKGFGRDPGAVRLERLATPMPNAADIYRVTSDDDVKHALDGRSAAILMAHRLAGKAAFRYRPDEGVVERVSMNGALPAQIARYLMLRHGCGPAVDFAEGAERRYLTPCDRDDAISLSGWLGTTFELPDRDAADANRLLSALVMQRARGGARGRSIAVQAEVQRC